MRVATRNTTHLLYTALALVTFYVSTPTYGSSVCDPSLLRRRTEVEQFKATHLRSGFEAPADNEAFLNRVIHTPEDGRSVYFHVDNAVLKMLNDKIFKDKELSAATLNLYKEIFFEELEKDRWVHGRTRPAHQGGVYSDFKIIRLEVRGRTDAEVDKIYPALEALHERVGTRFAAEMARHREIAALYQDRRGILADPANWNQAGFGKNAAQASIQARRNRRAGPGERTPGKPTRPRRFDAEAVLEVASQVREIEKLRLQLDDTFQHDPRIISEGVLTTDALDILRRAQGDLRITDLASYREYIEKRFQQRFDVRLTDEDVGRLQKYYHLANELAPSIYIKEKEPIALAEIKDATHGVVSFDVAGQNSLNMRATLLALFHAHAVHGNQKNDAKLVDLTLELTFEGQLRESDAFDASKATIGAALSRTHLRGEGTNTEPRIDGSLTASGDDATFLPSRPIGFTEKLRLLRNLRQTATPSRFRVTFQPQNDGFGQPIADARRFKLISQAEQLEKKLRDDLEAAGFSFEALKQTVFAVSVEPSRDGTVEVEVIYARSQEIWTHPKAQGLGNAIQKALETGLPDSFKLHRIYDADGVLGRPR